MVARHDHTNSWMFCEHANESPQVCSCAHDCICRTQGSCSSRQVISEVPEHFHHVSLLDLFETARQHVESRVGHMVMAADVQETRQLGFACVTCRSTFFINLDDFRKWIAQCPPEPRRLIGLFMHSRRFLADMMNAPGDVLRDIEPLTIELSDERKSSFERLLDDD